MQQTGRIGWIEMARALGACGVALLHVFVSTALVADLGVLRLGAYAALGIVLGRWAVPAFFMITGYLLLDPNRNVGWERARRYAWRMVLVLVTFGFVFACMEEAWTSMRAGEPLSLSFLVRAAVDVLTANTWNHLWYVYALVPVYLLAPAIRRVQSRVGERGFTGVSFLLFVGVLAVPTMVRLGAVLSGGTVDMAQQGIEAFIPNVAVGITCFCLGGCLRSWKLNMAFIACGIISLVAMLAVSLVGLVRTGFDMGFVFLQGSCFACLYALLVLMVLRHVVGAGPLPEGSWVNGLARDSFGIYVLHPVFVHLVLIFVDPVALPPGIFELAFYAFVLGASVVATRLVRRIPTLGGLL